jgi:hypothetical protein
MKNHRYINDTSKNQDQSDYLTKPPNTFAGLDVCAIAPHLDSESP